MLQALSIIFFIMAAAVPFKDIAVFHDDFYNTLSWLLSVVLAIVSLIVEIKAPASPRRKTKIGLTILLLIIVILGVSTLTLHAQQGGIGI